MTRTRTSLRRTAALAAFVLTALAGGALFALRADPEEREAPSMLAEDAASALRAARSEGAARRAPLNLAHAEDSYAAGLLETRRQELRLGILRDYTQARGLFHESLERAGQSAELARKSVRRDRTVASRALASADAAVSELAGVEDRIWISDPVRQRLQRARALVSEARSFVDAGAFTEAAERAREARTTAQGVSEALHATTARFTDDDNIRTWRGWLSETVEWSRRTGRVALVVDKDAHTLMVYQGGRLIREYDADLGWNNVGDKIHEGDGATPEGRYRITQLKGRGQSRYYKALLLDYPNREDIAHLNELKAEGAVPRSARPGSLIEIHGDGGRGKDWTDGCVAVTNAQMDWLFTRVAVGTPVTIVGSLSGDGSFSELSRKLER